MIFLAIRYLLARRRQTLLTLLGIFFGVAAYVSISGFFLGFRWYFIDQLVNNTAHVHIKAREDFLSDHALDKIFYADKYQHVFWDPPPAGRKDNDLVENPQNWYRRLRADPRVVAFSPQLTASVIFSKGTAKVSANLVGCVPEQQVKVTTIGDYVTEGKFSELASGGNRLVLGEELRKRLGVRLYQNVQVSLAGTPPVPFKVVGFFSTGIVLADSIAYGEISDVQKVNRTPSRVNEIAVRLQDYSQSSTMATAWALLGPEKVESWDQQNANIFNAFRIQDAIRYLTIAAIMIVAGFGIYNVLNMTVMQKRKDVAILRSLGYDTGDIVRLFFSQGVILGVSGSLLGLAFGYFFCRFLQTVPFGGGPLGRMDHLEISLDPAIYAQAAVLGIFCSCLASILPARAAGKLTPIEIIRAGAE